MKVARYIKPGVPLQVEEAPHPVPKGRQVVIKVCRCGICMTDIHMTSGGAFGYPTDSIIGHEVTGEVLELGPDVQHLKVGDNIAGFAVQGGCGKCRACVDGVPHWCTGGGHLGNYGGFAQISMMQEEFALRLPRTLSMEDGALIEPMACGVHGVNLARMDAGARVLVIGAGPIGLGSLFWARRMGASKVAIMARSDRRKDMAMTMGADAFISGTPEDPAQAVKAALGGVPDLVLECSGAPGTFGEALNLVRTRGTVVELGFCTQPDTFLPAVALSKELTVRFSFMYNMEDYQAVADVFDAGHVEPRVMVTQTVNLDQLPDAFEALRKPNDQCKVMVDPWA